MQGHKIIGLLVLTLLLYPSFGQNVPCDICGRTTISLYYNSSSYQITAAATFVNVSSLDLLNSQDFQNDKQYLTTGTGDPSSNSYGFATFDVLPLAGETLHFHFDDPSTGAAISGCENLVTDSNGVAKCTIGTSSLAGTCKSVYVSYAGNNMAPKRLPADSSIIVCDQNNVGVNAIGTSIANLVSDPANIVACFPISLIIGLLIASMYYSGRNPLSLFDITTPRLPKGKKAKMHKVTVGTNLLMALRLNKRQIREASAALRLANARVAMLLGKEAGKRNLVNKVMQSNLSDVAKAALLRRIALEKVKDTGLLDRLMRYLANKVNSKYELAALNRELYLKQIGGLGDKNLQSALLHSADLSGVLNSHLMTKQYYSKAYGFDKVAGKMIYSDSNVLGKVPLVNKVVLYTASAIASRRSVHGLKKDIRRQFAVEMAERMGFKKVLGKKDHFITGIFKGHGANPFEWITVDGKSFKTRKVADAKDPVVELRRKIDDATKALKERLALVALAQVSGERNKLLDAERAKIEALKKDLKGKLDSGSLNQKQYERKLKSLEIFAGDERNLIRSMSASDRKQFMSLERNILDAQRQAYIAAVSSKAVQGKLSALDKEFAKLYSDLAAAKTLTAQSKAFDEIQKTMGSFVSKANSQGSGLDMGKFAAALVSKVNTSRGGSVDLAKTMKVIDNLVNPSSLSKGFDDLANIDKKLSDMMKGFSNKFSFLFGEDVKSVSMSSLTDRKIYSRIYSFNEPGLSGKKKEELAEKTMAEINRQYNDALSGKRKSAVAAMMMDEVAMAMKSGKDYNSAVREAASKTFDRINGAAGKLIGRDGWVDQAMKSGHGLIMNRYAVAAGTDAGTPETKSRARQLAYLDGVTDRVVGVLDSRNQNLYKRLDSTREFNVGLYSGYKNWFDAYGKDDSRYKGKTFEEAYSDVIKRGITGGMLRQGVWVGDIDMKMMPYFAGMSLAEGDKVLNGKLYFNNNGEWVKYKPFKRDHDNAVAMLKNSIQQFSDAVDGGAIKTDAAVKALNLKDKNGNTISTLAQFNGLSRTDKIAAFTSDKLQIREKAPQMGGDNSITRKIANLGLFAEAVMIGGISNKTKSLQDSFATQAANRLILQQYMDAFNSGKYLPKGGNAELPPLSSTEGKKLAERVKNGDIDVQIVLSGLKSKIAGTDPKALEHNVVALQGKYSASAGNPVEHAKIGKQLDEARKSLRDYNMTYDDLRSVQKGIKTASYYDEFLMARKMGRQFQNFYNVMESSQMRDPRFGSSSYGMYQMLATGYHTGQGMYENPNIILGHNLLPGDFINKMSLKVTKPFAQLFGQHTRSFFSLAVGYPVVSDQAQARRPAYGEAVMSLLTPWESFNRFNRYAAPRSRRWGEFSTEEGFSLVNRDVGNDLGGGTKFKAPLPWTFEPMFNNSGEYDRRRFAKDYEDKYGTDIRNPDAPWYKWFFEKGHYSYINRSGYNYFQSGGSMRHYEMFKVHYQNVNKFGPPGMFFKDFEDSYDRMHPRIAQTLNANPELNIYKNLYYRNERANFQRDSTVDVWKRDKLAEFHLGDREHELAGFGFQGRFRPMAFAVPLLWPLFSYKEIKQNVEHHVEATGATKGEAIGKVMGESGKNLLKAPIKPFTKSSHKKLLDRTHFSCPSCGRALALGTGECPNCHYNLSQ
ncbi:MAG: hypothetical protein WC506_05990 [Candidatus Micrarchaeia archaeon]